MADELDTTQAAAQLAADATELAAAAATNDETDEEDYQWLTERLDAHENRQQAIQEQLSRVENLLSNREPSPELMTAFHALTEQNRTLTELVQTTQARMTELHEAVSLKLIPPTSTPSSQAADTEQTPNQNPAANPDSDGSAARTEPDDQPVRTKRRRI